VFFQHRVPSLSEGLQWQAQHPVCSGVVRIRWRAFCISTGGT